MVKNFRNCDFHFKTLFGPFWIDSDQQKFENYFYSSHFFDLWPPPFPEKNGCPQRKIIMAKNLQNHDFHFGIRFRPFRIDSDKKIRKKFWLCHFLPIIPIFREKWPIPRREVIMENIFRNRVFILKYVLAHFESMQIKKILLLDKIVPDIFSGHHKLYFLPSKDSVSSIFDNKFMHLELGLRRR